MSGLTLCGGTDKSVEVRRSILEKHSSNANHAMNEVLEKESRVGSLKKYPVTVYQGAEVPGRPSLSLRNSLIVRGLMMTTERRALGQTQAPIFHSNYAGGQEH